MSVRKKPFEFGVDGYTDAPPEVDEALRKAIPVDDVMFPSPEACAKAIHGRRKVHVSMMVDSETVEAFRDMAGIQNIGYQTLMNEVLGAYVRSVARQA